MPAASAATVVAEFAEHVLKQHADHRLVFDDEDSLGLRGAFGCHPSTPPLEPARIQNLTMHCGCPRALSFAGQGTAWTGPALSRGWGRAPNPSPIRR